MEDMFKKRLSKGNRDEEEDTEKNDRTGNTDNE